MIKPGEHSEWATPIVPVMKPDGTVRICWGYRMTVNKAAKLNTYPFLRIDDIFSHHWPGESSFASWTLQCSRQAEFAGRTALLRFEI